MSRFNGSYTIPAPITDAERAKALGLQTEIAANLDRIRRLVQGWDYKSEDFTRDDLTCLNGIATQVFDLTVDLGLDD